MKKHLQRVARFLAWFVKKTLLFGIENFWPLVRPVGVCRYTISCSQYAKLMLEQKPLHQALWLIAKRVVSCNPFYTCRHSR
jgi:putative component of membrane protein insertase Oxa1/YidC/SpoIIIJ protein YidD